MGKKIDKGRKNFNYSGSPKSYWEFAKLKAMRYISENKKESEFDKQKRLERDNKLALLETQVKERRRTEKRNEKAKRS